MVKTSERRPPRTGRASGPFLSEDNDGLKQEISVLKRDEKAPLG